jgi:hypothetical protein
MSFIRFYCSPGKLASRSERELTWIGLGSVILTPAALACPRSSRQ